MCDQSTAKGIVTYKDIQNSLNYARMKIIYEQLNGDKNKDLSWVWTNSDHTPSYNCPKGLTCYDGYVRINNKSTCNELGAKGFSQYTVDDPYKVVPSAKTGFFLEWKGDEKTGDCYMGNPYFKVQCITNNFDNHDKNDTKRTGKGLYWDENQGRCLITQDYCNSIGYNNNAYKPGPEANGNGGTCELTGWGDAGQFIFGQTITRGVFNGGCR